MTEQENKPVAEQEPAQPTAANGAPASAKKNGVGFKDNPTRYITTNAMLIALAFVAMIAIHVKAGFLTYDPKDVVIAIGGFMFGPLCAVIVSILVSLLEFISVSDTAFWGMFMNIISSLAFTLTASLIYKKKRSLKGAIIGLVAAIIVTVAIMVPTNYIVIPIYMGSRATSEFVASKLLPVIIPFNLLKGTINASIIMLLYKPLTRALRSAKMLPSDIKSAKMGVAKSYKNDIIIAVASVVVIAIAIILFIVWKNNANFFG